MAVIAGQTVPLTNIGLHILANVILKFMFICNMTLACLDICASCSTGSTCNSCKAGSDNPLYYNNNCYSICPASSFQSGPTTCQSNRVFQASYLINFLKAVQVFVKIVQTLPIVLLVRLEHICTRICAIIPVLLGPMETLLSIVNVKIFWRTLHNIH